MGPFLAGPLSHSEISARNYYYFQQKSRELESVLS